MGGSEIIVILIVALLFLGPDKLPQAAKSISKGIRDIKKQSRSLQQQIENDDQIGGAIRDLKSALRGEEPRPKPRPAPARELPATVPEAAGELAGAAVAAQLPEPGAAASEAAAVDEPDATSTASTGHPTPVRLPATAGEPDPDVTEDAGDDDLGSLIRPAEGAIAKGSEPKHG